MATALYSDKERGVILAAQVADGGLAWTGKPA